MKAKKWLRTFATSLLGMVILTSLPSDAQTSQLSLAQARQALLSYVQAPDTTLVAAPVSSTNISGHTEYLFYGDLNGEYSIDAVSGEKIIGYSGLSGGSQTPVNHVSEAQLQQTATAYVSQHFPNYVSSMFQMHTDPLDVNSDADEYYVHFTSTATSGAIIPIKCTLILEEDSGKVKTYQETSIPVTTSTTPAITQSQAVQSGQNWIYQNFSTSPDAGNFLSDIGGASPIVFEVNVDSLMNQSLVYKIEYTALPVMIDAQTGAVIGTDGYASVPTERYAPPKRSATAVETFWKMQLSKITPYGLGRSAILTRGQTFLWPGYLKLAGIHQVQYGNFLTLSSAKKQMRLKIANEATADNHVTWQRKDGIYVPLAAIQSLTNAFVKRPDTQEIVINLPIQRK